MDLSECVAIGVIAKSEECCVLDSDGHVVVYDATNQVVDEFWQDVDTLVCGGKDTVIGVNFDNGQVHVRGGKTFELKRGDGLIGVDVNDQGDRLALLYANEIKCVSLSGESLYSVGLCKKLDQSMEPRALSFFNDDLIVVLVDDSALFCFDSMGRVKKSWHCGSYVENICVDSKGNILAVHSHADCVQVYTQTGHLTWTFEDDGDGAPLTEPKLVCCYGDGNVVVVFGSEKIAFLGWDDEGDEDDDDDEQSQVYEEESFEAEDMSSNSVTVNILRTQNLVEELSEAYVRVNLYVNGKYDEEKWQKTPTVLAKHGILEWNAVHILEYEAPSSAAIAVRLELWDSDVVSDIFVGGTCFSLEDQDSSSSRALTLRDARGEICGELEIDLNKKQPESRKSATQKQSAKTRDSGGDSEESDGDDSSGSSDNATIQLTQQLVLAITKHKGYRRLEALTRLNAHVNVGNFVDSAAIRSLISHFKSSKSRIWNAARDFLVSLLSRGHILKLVKALDFPGLIVGEDMFYFYIPEGWRELYAKQVDDDGLSEENYLEFLKSNLVLSESYQTVGMGRIPGSEELALGFQIGDIRVREMITKKQVNTTWSQGRRLEKLAQRFEMVGPQNILYDPVVALHVNLFSHRRKGYMEWEELRQLFLFQAYQRKFCGTAKQFTRKRVQLLVTVTGIQGRTCRVRIINIRKTEKDLKAVVFLVVDTETDLKFTFKTILKDDDPLLMSTDALRKLVHNLGFTPEDLEYLGASESRVEDDPVWPLQMVSERVKQQARIDPVKELRGIMPVVANHWNFSERKQACALLLEKAVPVIGKVTNRETRVRMSKAIKRARVEYSEENTIRLWRVCEKFLRKFEEESLGDNQPKVEKPRHSCKAFIKDRKLTKEIVQRNISKREKELEDQRVLLEKQLEEQLRKHKQRQREKMNARQKLRHDRLEANRLERERIEKQRLQQAKQHAQWYRETSRLEEIQNAMLKEKKREQDKRIAKARLENDKLIEKNRLKAEKSKLDTAVPTLITTRKEKIHDPPLSAVSSEQSSVIDIPDTLEFT